MIKQRIAWLPAIMLAVFLAQGCGSDSSDTPPPSPATETTKPAEQPAETEETAESSETTRPANRTTEQAPSQSDDGQRVWINEQRIIDDWNHHGVKAVRGSIELDAGLQPIRVEFFQGSGGAAITVYWEGPNFDKTVLAGDALWTYPIPTKDGE